MRQALYRKWRPQVFDDVYGQEHITSVLRYEVEHQAFNHAYLFCGSRGTGKTSCAKILAKAINCDHPKNGSPCGACDSCRAIESGAATDILEMDAASNNGVENIRDIRDEVVYSPSTLKKRVYIIDEVHMLSASAFNALLKTLEEPPEHVVFILATTELQKLPATIISRCQRFDFRRISVDALVQRLTHIAKEEHIELDADAARLLARLAQGGMRDAISLLELCAGGNRTITAQVVEASVGITGREGVVQTVQAIAERNYDALFEQIATVVRSSKDLSVFWQDLLSFYRDMLVVRSTKNASAYLDLSDCEAEQMRACAGSFCKETLLFHCKLLEEALLAMQKSNAVKRVIAELTLLRMCDEMLDTSNEALLSRVAHLEEQVAGGGLRASREQPVAPQEHHGANPSATVVPSAAQETSTESQKPDTVAAKVNEVKRVLRPLRGWTEVVDRIGHSDQMLAGFVKHAKAYTAEDESIVVRFENAFSMQMLQRDEARDRLRMALSAVLRREVDDRMLRMEVVGQATENSAIDEILEGLED